MQQKLKPLTSLTVAQLFDENGMSRIRYMQGYPRSYRFDASKGLLTLDGETAITTASNKTFSFVPLAYRIFKDTLFNYQNMKWLEVFFLNESMQLCSCLFHQYSVQNFLDYAYKHLYYSGCKVCEVLWTVTPVEKLNEKVGSKYHIAQFSATPLSTSDIEAIQTARTVLSRIVRYETVTDDCETVASLFYDMAQNVDLLQNNQTVAENLDALNDAASQNFAKGVTKRDKAA
jgi:hypothetical protein